MVKARDLSGIRFGRLIAIQVGEPIGKRKARSYLCLCDCGKQRTIRAESLFHGITKSCGCIRNENTANLRKSHGKTNTPEYKSWSHAKNRVLNKNNPKYAKYGGRGITMSEEWINSFDAFYKDMGNKPSNKSSLGRIDVNKGYCKENCRWEDSSQQARARTDNIFVDVNGSKMILKDACNLVGLNYKKTHFYYKLGKIKLQEVFDERKL